MRSLSWAVIALRGYTLVPPLVTLATESIHNEVVLVIPNGIRLVVGVGIALTVGIVAYYRGLAAGPVSVVVPIFGMFIATTSIVGIAVLDEPLTAKQVRGIGLAIAAVSHCRRIAVAVAGSEGCDDRRTRATRGRAGPPD